MIEGKNWLHYDIMSNMQSEIHKKLLTEEHLKPYKIEIKKMNLPDGASDDEYNFRGWELVKNNTRYLVSDTANNKPIKIKETLPILPKDILELGSKGVVYSHIKRPVSMRFKSQKSMPFKEFVNTLSRLEHSNPRHHTLANMIGLTSTLYRCNTRIASNPAFGKDSVVEVHNGLIGKCGTIESPTLAKLEERSSVLNWLVVNEVVDITPAEWRIIQQFLLATGAHKPEVTKHSRAHGTVGEVIDLSSLSLSLFYNDITDYPKVEDYFDFVTKSAVRDRFPAFRLYGRFTEDFNALQDIDKDKYTRDNINDFKDIIYNYTYYKNNINKYIHGYDRSKLDHVKSRAKTNVGRLINIIDAYCDSQEEFDGWVETVNNSMKDYNEMLKYPSLLPAYYKKLNIPAKVYDEFNSIEDCLHYLKSNESKLKNSKHKIQYTYKIIGSDTFTDKNKLIYEYTDEIKIEDNFW